MGKSPNGVQIGMKFFHRCEQMYMTQSIHADFTGGMTSLCPFIQASLILLGFSLGICSQLYHHTKPHSINLSCKSNKLFLHGDNKGFKWNMIKRLKITCIVSRI